MATRKRKVNVQLPGEVSTESPMATDAANDGAAEQNPESAKPAERVTEVIVKQVMKGRAIDKDYENMSADEVDPSMITRPVLTKDGWVVPHKPEKPKV